VPYKAQFNTFLLHDFTGGCVAVRIAATRQEAAWLETARHYAASFPTRLPGHVRRPSRPENGDSGGEPA